MPSFSQIYSQFNNAKAQNLIGPEESLSSYAKKALALTGDPSYQSVAEGGTVGNFVRSRSADLTNFINSGPVDEWLGEGTKWVGDRFGINPEVSRGVGESLPRMAVDFLPMAVGAALAPISGGSSLALAGLGATSALSAANAYEQEGKLSDAIIGGAAPYVGSKLSEIGGRAALNLVPKSKILQSLGFTGGSKLTGQALTAAEQAGLAETRGLASDVIGATTKSFTRLDKPMDKLLHYAGGEVAANVGFTGLDIVQQGTDAVFNRDYLFANLVSNIPFAAADLAGSFAHRQLGETQFNIPEAKPVYLTPGEEKAVYAAAMFKDLEKSPEAVEAYRKKYGLDIADLSIKTEGLKMALNAKESGLRTAELDFVTKWNDYVNKTPLARDAGFESIQRGGAFGRDFVGLDKVLGKAELPAEAKELVDQFKSQRSSLRSSYSAVVNKLADPISISESLPKAIQDLNLDEFLQTPIEKRDYAKALEKTFLSLDGVDLIRDIHRREAGLEPLRPELYQEFVDLYSGKPASFTPDKRIELTVAASLARGAVPKFEKAKKKVQEAQEEGKTQAETVQEVVQAFQEENAPAEMFKQPVILDDTQSGLVMPAQVEGDVMSQVPAKPVETVQATREPAPQVAQTITDRLIASIPAKWSDSVKQVVADFYRTGDDTELQNIGTGKDFLLIKQIATRNLSSADPAYEQRIKDWNKDKQAKDAAWKKMLNKVPVREAVADEFESTVLSDDTRIDQQKLPIDPNSFEPTQWARVVDQNKQEHLIPLPEGELQRVEAFARGILAKLVPAEELPARSEELIGLAKMFNNPELAYAELGRMKAGKQDFQFADGYYMRPAVRINGVVKEGRLHVDAWQQHLRKPFSEWNNDPAFKNSKEHAGFMTPDGFLSREQAKIEFEKRGGKLKMDPGEAPRDWLDASDLAGFQFARATSSRHTELEAKHEAGILTPEEANEARILVERAAKAAGYNVGPVSHWSRSDEPFNVFDLNKAQEGFHFGSEQAANARANDQRGRRFEGKLTDKGHERKFYIKGKPLKVNDLENNHASSLLLQLQNEGKLNSTGPTSEWNIISAAEAKEDLRRGKNLHLAEEDKQKVLRLEAALGRELEHPMKELDKLLGDDVLFEYTNNSEDKGSTSYAVVNPNQIKSAELFTGVPLDQRFQSASDDVRFAQNQGRIYGAASYNKMQILINSKAFQSKSPAEQLKFIWAHENSHISFRKSLEGQYGPKAKALADASLAWVNAADPQARRNVEDVVRELHLDKELGELDGIRDVLNNPDPQEWLANVWAMYALGTLKPKNPKAAFSMLPRPIREFFEWAVSGIQSLTKGAQMWARLSGKDYKAAKDMQNLMNTVRRSFRQAEWDAAQAEKFLDIEPSSMIERGNDFAYAQSSDRMGQVGEQPFVDNPKRWIGSQWNKIIQPIHTLANAHKEFVEPVLAVMNAPLDTENAIGDVSKIVVGELDSSDKLRMTNKAFTKVRASESLTKLSNALMARSQVINRRMIKLKDGPVLAEMIDFDAMSPELRGQFNQFNPEAQQALVTYLAQAERANMLSQKKFLESDWSHLVHDLATLISTKASFKPEDFKKAPAIAEGLMNDLKVNDVEGAVSKLASLDDTDRAKMMEQAQDLFGQYAKLEEFYNKHPTYMSFRRFGEIKQRISKPGEADDVVDADTELELQAKLKPYLDAGWTQKFGRITKKEPKDQQYRVNSELLKLMTEREKAFKAMIEGSGSITPEGKAMLLSQATSSEAMLKEINSRELYKPTTGRKLSGDLTRYDWYEQFQQYTPAALAAAQRRALGAKVNFWMQNPELTDMKLQKDQFMALYEQSKKPDPEWARKLNKTNAVWHIGWNLPGHIAEVFQPMVSLLPELQAKGESLPGALRMLQKAEKDVIKMHGYRLKDKLFKPGKAQEVINGETFEGLAAMWIKANGKSKQTLDEARMLHEKRGRIQKAPLSELRDFTGERQSRLQDAIDGKPQGKFIDVIKRPFHTYANAAMSFYSNFTQHNGVVSLVTAYRKFRKDGMSHEDAMQQAELFDLTVNNSGGRLERPEMFGKLGGAGHLPYGLTSFVRGRFSQLATFYRHGFDEEQFKGKLTTKEIGDAKKAFQTMILAQVGAAGVLGLPFVGAGIALMEELLGEDIKGKMITALDEVTNDPLLTRVFTHGMMSTVAESLGIPADLHSRFALSSFLGTNAYDGISAKSFMGPSVAMLDSMFNLGGELARGESLEKALTVAGPGGVKRLAEALSEDFQRDNPEADLVSSMMGFRSSQMVKRKEWDQITRKQELESRRDLEKSAMEIVKAMEINPAKARQQLLIEADKLVPKGLDYQGTVQQRQQNVKDLIQKVSNIQADKVGPSDPRRAVSGRVAPVASQTAQAMGVQMQNPMELARAMMQQKTRSQLGATSSQRPVRNAMLQEMQWGSNPWEF